jgi:phage terminase large subunit-like protein
VRDHQTGEGRRPAAREGAVGLDPVGVAAIVDELATIGIEGEQLVAVAQGFRLNGAVLGHGAQAQGRHALAWRPADDDVGVGNAKTEQRGNAVLITKQVAGKAKIDPLMAAFDAVMLMSRNPEAKASLDVMAMVA